MKISIKEPVFGNTEAQKNFCFLNYICVSKERPSAMFSILPDNNHSIKAAFFFLARKNAEVTFLACFQPESNRVYLKTEIK